MFGIDQKLIIGLLVMAMWGMLVIRGISPVDAYVEALKNILYGICLYHISQQNKA